MSNKGIKLMFAAAVLGVAAMAMPVAAQPGGGGGGRGQGGQGGRGRGGANVAAALTAAGATDAEMTKITPLLTAVQTAQAATQLRAFGGGRGGGGNAPAPSELQTAVTDLTTTLADAAATPDTIKTKLKAVRDAKAKAMEELKKAQKALTEVLTPKEEAVLVSQGILE